MTVVSDPDVDHVFIQFKECPDNNRLRYPSRKVSDFIEDIC